MKPLRTTWINKPADNKPRRVKRWWKLRYRGICRTARATLANYIPRVVEAAVVVVERRVDPDNRLRLHLMQTRLKPLSFAPKYWHDRFSKPNTRSLIINRGAARFCLRNSEAKLFRFSTFCNSRLKLCAQGALNLSDSMRSFRAKFCYDSLRYLTDERFKFIVWILHTHLYTVLYYTLYRIIHRTWNYS